MPPMLELAKQLTAGYQTECQLVMGYRSETFLTKEMEANGTLYIATEDGSTGTKETLWMQLQRTVWKQM